MDAKCFPLSFADCALVNVAAYGLCSVTERREKKKKNPSSFPTVIAAQLSVLHKFIIAKKKKKRVGASKSFMFSLADSFESC